MRSFGNGQLKLAGFIGVSLFLHAALLLNIHQPQRVSVPRQVGTLSIALVEKTKPSVDEPQPRQKEPVETSRPTPATTRAEPIAQTDEAKTESREIRREAEQAQAPSPASADPSQASNEIKRELKNRLRTHFSYPLLAVRRGWQGDVELSFRVLANGRLINIRVARSSGHALLDRSALEALRRVNHVRDTRHWLQQDHLDMTLPIRYQLKEG